MRMVKIPSSDIAVCPIHSLEQLRNRIPGSLKQMGIIGKGSRIHLANHGTLVAIPHRKNLHLSVMIFAGKSRGRISEHAFSSRTFKHIAVCSINLESAAVCCPVDRGISVEVIGNGGLGLQPTLVRHVRRKKYGMV